MGGIIVLHRSELWTTCIFGVSYRYRKCQRWVLHDWNAEDCVKILRQCKAAVIKNGRKGNVIIIDMVIENQNEDEKSIETQLFFDMLMMVLVTGRERNEKEWAKLFLNAGFGDYKITPILGTFKVSYWSISLLSLYKLCW